MADNFYHGGEPYPDGFTALAVNSEDIPEDLRTEFKGALEASRKPAGELKSDSGTGVQERLYVSPEPSQKPDYDYAGWQKATGLTELPPGQHYPDTYKLPNHITFSDQSQYSNNETPGGNWATNPDGSYTFTPSAFNLSNNPPSVMQDYFSRMEKGNTLNLDTPQGMAAQATELAQGALKRAQGTLPSLDSDTGINGAVIHPTPDYLRAKGIDTAITEGDYDQAKDLMMSFSGGGLTFAGVKSRMVLDSPAAKANLYNAIRSDIEGATADEIYTETGWFKGRDNRWRYELSDTNAKLKEEGLTPIPAKKDNPNGWSFVDAEDRVAVPDKGTKLGDIYDHPELYTAYPWLHDLPVERLPANQRNSYYGVFLPDEKKILMNDLTHEQFRSTLAHEIQHAIQIHEGFAQGGNSSMFTPTGLQEAISMWRKAESDLIHEAVHTHGIKAWDFGIMQSDVGAYLKGSTAPKVLQRVNDLKGVGDLFDRMVNIEKGRELLKQQSAKQDEQYRRLMGEVESRNVQRRLDMSPAERDTQHPFSTEDRPGFVQIERGTGFGKGMGSEVTPIRRAANDNISPEEFVNKFKEDLPKYNTELDTSPLDRMLKDNFYQNVTKPHEEFIAAYDKLHEFGEWMSKKENYSEFNVARYNKMGKELSELNGDTWEPVKYIPKNEYVPSKDVAEYLAQADAQKAKMTESVKKSWLDMLKDYFKE